MGKPQQPHDPRGALVRPYAVTRGRTEPQRNIPIELGAEQFDETAVMVDTFRPLGVTRVLVADMVAEGLLSLHSAAPKEGFTERMDLLERVLSGLRKL